MSIANFDITTANANGVHESALDSDLRLMDLQSGYDKNARAINMIHVCLDHGVNTAGQIIAALQPYDYKRGHVGAMLKHGTGYGSYGNQWNVHDKVYIAL